MYLFVNKSSTTVHTLVIFSMFSFFFRKFLQMRWQSLIEKSSINVKMKFQKKKKKHAQ